MVTRLLLALAVLAFALAFFGHPDWDGRPLVAGGLAAWALAALAGGTLDALWIRARNSARRS